jgi:acyl-CoA thioesterase-1
MKRQSGILGTIIFACSVVMAGVLAAMSPSAAQAPEKKQPTRLVALGDSLSAGYELPQDAAFPVVLERALKERGYKVEVANAGVSGDTASGGLERLDWSVPDGTDGVILELGANDMLRGIDPAVTRQAIEGIVERLESRGIAVMLAGMRAAPNLGPEYVAKFEGLYRDIAQRHGLVLYPFFLDGVAGDRTLLLPDGLHPTRKGVELIVRGILPSVETFLARITQR